MYNENTNAPVFTSGNSASTPENVLTTAVVYDANATDANGDPITFSLSAGGDNDKFSIDRPRGRSSSSRHRTSRLQATLITTTSTTS